MPTDVETLMEMGFTQNRSEKALAKTNYKGVQVAMDWLFAHSEDPDIDDPFEAPKGHVLSEETKPGGDTEGAPGGEGEKSGEGQAQQAMSLKCDDCGKLLKSELDAQAHAARTQHSNFSESTEEIKPLTEEEKKEQMERLQEKMKQRRLEREMHTKQDKIDKEKMRRAQGKDMSLVKQQMQEKEMKKIAELKRKEKEEEKLARQRVKDEIERDKRERAAKFAKQSGQGAPAAAGASAGAAALPTAVPPAEPQAAKEYTECRLQIRLTNGQALVQTFKAKEPLAAVRLYVEMNRSDGSTPFKLMTSYPRRIFTEEDMEKPLTELGLVPSSVLMVTKAS